MIIWPDNTLIRFFGPIDIANDIFAVLFIFLIILLADKVWNTIKPSTPINKEPKRNFGNPISGLKHGFETENRSWFAENDELLGKIEIAKKGVDKTKDSRERK